MRRAFEHDNQNPNVLNHLANHFFFTGVRCCLRNAHTISDQ